MKSKHAKWVLVGSMAFGLLSPAPAMWAADPPATVTDPAHPDARIVKSSQIIGRPVTNARGNDIGRVMDLIIDPVEGKVAYAIMRFGDWFDETRFVIPFAALKEEAGKSKLILDITKDKLDKNKGFKATAYPDMSDTTWARDLHREFGVTPYWQDDVDNDNPRRRLRDRRDRSPQLSKDHPWGNRVNEMIGKPVYGTDAFGREGEVGKVKDLAVDVRYRHVVAYIVSRGSGETQVPFASLTAQGKDNRFVVSTAPAETQPSTTPRTATTPSTPQPKTSSVAADNRLQNAVLLRADQIIKDIVEDPAGKDIGRVMDLIIDGQQGQVAYAIMRFGEWYGQTRFAVPFAALKWDATGKNFVIDLTKDKLDRNKGFSAESYPDMSDANWAKELHTQFNVKPYWQLGEARADDDTRRRGRDSDLVRLPQISKENVWINRVSGIVGKPVITVSADANGKHTELGTVKDLVIDVTNGQVVYAVLATAGNAERLVMVPWSAMEENPADNRFAVRTTVEDLARDGFNAGAWPNMNDAQWARRVHERFNQDPYWTVFGFGGATEWDPAWRRGSTYNKLFNESSVKTVRGKVTRMGTFSADATSGKGRMLTLETDDGVRHTVHLGPTDWIDRDNTKFRIREGDELSITGSSVKFEGADVIIASRVRKGDDSLDLRNRSGAPMWDRLNNETDSNP